MNELTTRRRSALVGGGAGALLFGLLAWAVQADPHWLRSLDHGLGAGPERFTSEHRWLLHAANFVADLTQPDFLLLPVVVCVVVLGLHRYWRTAVWVLIVFEVARWGYFGLKAVFERPRPHWENPAAHAAGWSFPSGHSAVIAAVAGITIVLAIMFCPTRQLRFRTIGAAVLVAAVVGFDRILLGVHYPSDVLGGLLLGASTTLLALAVFDPLPRADRPRRTTIAP